MREFWVASGHHLARRDEAGRLAVTDELLLAWLARPEALPPPDACAAERALHARLTADPRAPVSPADVAALADPDARANWEWLTGFRDLMVAAGTVEAAWLRLVRERRPTPPLIHDQLVQLILRNALDGCEDPFVLRAAELMFRPQTGFVKDGALVLVDGETADAIDAERAAAPLVALLNPEPYADVDVMTDATAWTWWSRSDAHTMALPWGAETAARAGLATAMAAFLRHLLGVAAEITPMSAVADADFRWYVGLDAEGTKLGDALWRRGKAPPALAERLIGLFRLDLTDAAQAAADLRGAPVWLILTATADLRVRMKPQNLAVGLPLAVAD